MSGIYVTGTDTDVGKTVMSAGIARSFLRRGIRVGVMKPFASGSYADSRCLQAAARSTLGLKRITPFYFRHPLAPEVSLKLERRTPRHANLIRHYCYLKKRHDFIVVEGIGGAAVPIHERFDALDAAKTLRLPIVIVARLSLGTLNHTFLTVEHARRKKLKVKGIILNAYPNRRKGLAEKTNPAAIERHTGVRVLGVLPYLTGRKSKDVDFVADMLEKHIELGEILC